MIKARGIFRFAIVSRQALPRRLLAPPRPGVRADDAAVGADHAGPNALLSMLGQPSAARLISTDAWESRTVARKKGPRALGRPRYGGDFFIRLPLLRFARSRLRWLRQF